ncbi:MAG: tRNA dihydrouridine synthase DusB [Rhodobiaceae bacterium]|jgi:tRNA-dihydrouridine synthase B|nr:tRNA dihydrouridine synthase DusB [Rhodobiaceae bacterium]MBT5518977.1 tRNA dihydrouridine synthase DusB [Rhodobiaceae bacterium]MBT7279157.1 tRNA dihydrouridine synthase DusB [Rhodobiaceae bacterium]
MTISLGSTILNSRVLLAPMSGVTDLAFRQCVSKVSSAQVVSEMVASEEWVKARPDVLLRAEGAGLTPFMLQLAGRDPHWMREGAKLACEAGADIVDINMGCPSRQVTGGLSGSALMRDEALAESIIAATCEGSSKPVTLKMRLGWDDDSLNAPHLACVAQGLGVQMITVHGRTRCQFYKGKANWQAIAETVSAVDIPVLVNGDIIDGETAKAALEASGAAGVMVGRAAVGRPWLLGQIAGYLDHGTWAPDPCRKAQWQIFQDWYAACLALYGDYLGVRVGRKHIAGFIESFMGVQAGREMRAQICRSHNPQVVLAAMQEMYETQIQQAQQEAA